MHFTTFTGHFWWPKTKQFLIVGVAPKKHNQHKMSFTNRPSAILMVNNFDSIIIFTAWFWWPKAMKLFKGCFDTPRSAFCTKCFLQIILLDVDGEQLCFSSFLHGPFLVTKGHKAFYIGQFVPYFHQSGGLKST